MCAESEVREQQQELKPENKARVSEPGSRGGPQGPQFPAWPGGAPSPSVFMITGYTSGSARK